MKKERSEIFTDAQRATAFNELAKELHAGMTTKDVDRLGEELIRSYGCIPSLR